MMSENEISHIVIGCAINVHKQLGPGLLESVYQKCLFYEITQTGMSTIQQHPIPVIYKGVELDMGYKADLIIENKLIIELKSVENLNDVHLAQILTYLRLSKCKLGLLMNFNVVKLTEGLRRVVNNL